MFMSDIRTLNKRRKVEDLGFKDFEGQYVYAAIFSPYDLESSVITPQSLYKCRALNLSVILQLLENVDSYITFTNSHIAEVGTSAEEGFIYDNRLWGQIVGLLAFQNSECRGMGTFQGDLFRKTLLSLAEYVM